MYYSSTRHPRCTERFFFQLNPVWVILKITFGFYTVYLFTAPPHLSQYCMCYSSDQSESTMEKGKCACAYILHLWLKRGKWSMRCVYVLHHTWKTKKSKVYGNLFPQKCNNSLQETFIHPLKPCEALFIMDRWTLLDMFWTVKVKHLPVVIVNLKSTKYFLNIRSDWIQPKDESHINLRCIKDKYITSFLGVFCWGGAWTFQTL